MTTMPVASSGPLLRHAERPGHDRARRRDGLREAEIGRRRPVRRRVGRGGVREDVVRDRASVRPRGELVLPLRRGRADRVPRSLDHRPVERRRLTRSANGQLQPARRGREAEGPRPRVEPQDLRIRQAACVRRRETKLDVRRVLVVERGERAAGAVDRRDRMGMAGRGTVLHDDVPVEGRGGQRPLLRVRRRAGRR